VLHLLLPLDMLPALIKLCLEAAGSLLRRFGFRLAVLASRGLRVRGWR
jgi:hypothetical protein